RGATELGLYFWPLVVEHAQRVQLDPLPGLFVQVEGTQEVPQRLAVDRTAFRVAKRVEQQLDLAEPEVAGVDVPAGRVDLGVQRRFLAAEPPRVELVDLPVPARLRPLVPEHRT